MSDPEIVRARQEAERARRQLQASLGELQTRLRPGTIASNAMAGVRERSGELAEDAVEAVKARPVAVSAALAAFTLFLARAPIKSAVSKLFSSDEEEDLVTTRLVKQDRDYDLTAPVAERASPRPKKKKKQGADS